ncbi:MAG: SCO family protein [Hyphomicrobiales bacterium]|nr:MAG: SCO family protein [Hyphomicrobiales bacterium]
MSRLNLAILLVCGLLVGALAAVAVIPDVRNRVFPEGSTRAVGQALVGGPFTLTDHTGRKVTDQDYRGKFMLVFFGFTYCPDVCPTALQTMAAALEMLGPKAERLVPLFITVDPERDTPEQLAQYVSSFSPKLVGLTGTRPEIDTVLKEYRVYAQKVEDPKSTAGYTMNHSSIVYIMGPDGAYRTHFTHATGAETMAERLAKLL